MRRAAKSMNSAMVAQDPLAREVLFPLTRNTGLARQSVYEGVRAPLAGPASTRVGGYTSPFAPVDLMSIGVLTDARNRVGF